MKKNEKTNSLLANTKPSTIKGIEKKSIGSGRGSNLIVLKYLLEIDDKERRNGLTAKQIGNGIAKLYGIAILDSKVRAFFRENFNVGRVNKDNPKYDAYNEKPIGGNMYFAHASQEGIME